MNKIEKSNTMLYRRMNDKMRYLDDQLPLKLQEHERILLSGMQDTLQKYREETQDLMVKALREKKDAVLLVTLLPSVLQTSIITVPDVNTVYRISCVTSVRLWVNDDIGNLRQLDSTGNVLQSLKGYYTDHTVTEDGDLLFIQENEVKKLTSDGTVTSLFTTDWKPLCIHSSHITGDILVGTRNIDRGIGISKVTRYHRTGQKIQDIEEDNQGQKLYRILQYITENKNGDVWTSDISMLVVVDKSGQHRFNYKGQQSQSKFTPWGICTDILGHVLVCDNHITNPSVHLLDQDGQLLSVLLSKQHIVHNPRALCVDDKHNLYLGQSGSNTITVYKYLQVAEK